MTGLVAASALAALVACAPAAPPTPTTSAPAKTTGAATTTSATTGAATTTSGTTGGATTTTGVTGTRPAGAATTTAGTTGSTGSSTPGAVGAAVGTTTALAPIAFAGAKLDPTDPQVMLRNSGSSMMDLAGWKLRVGSSTASLPSSAQVSPGDTVTIHFGTGTSSGKDWYLGSDAASLMPGLRPGARVQLENPQGNVVTDFSLPG